MIESMTCHNPASRISICDILESDLLNQDKELDGLLEKQLEEMRRENDELKARIKELEQTSIGLSPGMVGP